MVAELVAADLELDDWTVRPDGRADRQVEELLVDIGPEQGELQRQHPEG